MRKGCAAVKTIEHEHGHMCGCVWCVVCVYVCVRAGVGEHAEKEKVSERSKGTGVRTEREGRIFG
jgi:hypothetical protein